MGKLIYMANVSLDGYIEDPEGNFDWTPPSHDRFAFINSVMRGIGTHVYGRRLYETMAVWESIDTGPEQEAVMREFAGIWRSVDKVVYSTTLGAVRTARTRLERSFDAQQVREMKTSAAKDIVIGGPNLAAHAFKAGLIDECHLYVIPIIVGGGKAAFPEGVRQPLTLIEHRRFGDGAVFLRYGCPR